MYLNGMSQSPLGGSLGRYGEVGGGNPMAVLMQMLIRLVMSVMQSHMGQMTGQGMMSGASPGFGGSPGCAASPGTPGTMPGFNRFGGGNTGGAGAPSHVPNVPAAGSTNSKIANQALGWNNKAFKAGQTKRCADFVSTVLRQSGANVKHTVAAAGLANQGSAVGKDQLKPGDVVLFGNTYRRGKYTHVGIYVGNGKFVHRPTANKPVRTDRLDSGYYARKFTGARRFQTR